MTCLPSCVIGSYWELDDGVDDACTLGRSVVKSYWISFNSTVVLELSLFSKSSCWSASSADSESALSSPALCSRVRGLQCLVIYQWWSQWDVSFDCLLIIWCLQSPLYLYLGTHSPPLKFDL